VNAELSTNVSGMSSASVIRFEMNPDDRVQAGVRKIGFCSTLMQ
jgi:hypothetical protein